MTIKNTQILVYTLSGIIILALSYSLLIPLYDWLHLFFPDIRRISQSTKRAVSVKVHFTQTNFLSHSSETPGVSPFLPFCMAQHTKGTISLAVFPSFWLPTCSMDAFWLLMSCCLPFWWPVPYDTLNYLFSGSICTQCLPGIQIKTME